MTKLNNISPELLARLPVLASRWRAGECDAAEFAALYFFHWQIAIYGQAFASRKRKHDPRPDAAVWLKVLETAEGERLRPLLLDWLERYQFRGVIGNVPVALLQWLRGAWPLILREDIPSPRDILRWQARGTRAATVITAWPRAREPVLNKSDAFAFFRHDLEHAYKFYHSPALYAGQCAFFARLEAAVDRGVFAPYIHEAEFVIRFHYLMSDMNTHPEHSRQYLRAILIEFYRRRESKAHTEWLSAEAERAIEEVMRDVHAVTPLPSDGVGQGPSALLRWELTPPSERLSA
ncbi:MAG: hypothetical protein WB402_12185 [Sulfuricaulis sp.]|uniref:hypothetical protein n=1 Tax=Sulfuricaulis sp. TaxID=2003553 RepID=UPI003C55D2D8